MNRWDEGLAEADQTIAQHRKTAELDPNSFYNDSSGAVAYREKGMFAESVAEYQRLQRVTGGHLFSGLAITYARMGKTTEARTILREFLELSKRKYLSPEQIALIAHFCSTRASDAVTVLANC